MNNAFYKSGEFATRWIKDIPMDEFRRKMQANVFAPLALAKGFLPKRIERKHERVINLSTRHNYICQSRPPGEGSPTVCYNTSKAADDACLADGASARIFWHQPSTAS